MQAVRGALIAYATAPGAVAADGVGRNGTYTKYLLRYLATPDLLVEQMFKRVRVAVEEETGGIQTPWEASSLQGDFSFYPSAATRPSLAVVQAPPPQAQTGTSGASVAGGQAPPARPPGGGPAHGGGKGAEEGLGAAGEGVLGGG